METILAVGGILLGSCLFAVIVLFLVGGLDPKLWKTFPSSNHSKTEKSDDIGMILIDDKWHRYYHKQW